MRILYAWWTERHTERRNLLLHALGIPLTVAAIPVLILYSWKLALTLFILGYALQFIGHALEGNRAGERLLVDKLLRRPPQ